jgi:hypothetical protein
MTNNCIIPCDRCGDTVLTDGKCRKCGKSFASSAGSPAATDPPDGYAARATTPLKGKRLKLILGIACPWKTALVMDITAGKISFVTSPQEDAGTELPPPYGDGGSHKKGSNQ